MGVYVYESHLGGGFYTSSEPLDYDELYCDSCGDSDTYCGYYKEREELKEMLYDWNYCNYKYDDEVSKYMTKEEYEQDIKERIEEAENMLNGLWEE